MRYLGLLIILSFVSLTWHLSKLEAKVPVGIHHDIQMDLAKIITTAIQTQLPQAKNVEFKRLFSEAKTSDEVHVFFEYAFEDDKEPTQGVSTGISGEAVVKRNPADPATWILDTVRLSESTIEFKDGIVVTREGDGSAAAPEVDSAHESDKSKKHSN
jgi:hypothetical protein